MTGHIQFDVNGTSRLNILAYLGASTANYSYSGNSKNKQRQQTKNQTSASVLLSQFDYTYDTEGELLTWKKNYPGLATPQRYDLGYDNADQLLTAPLKKATNNALIRQYSYGYDPASNRTSEQAGITRRQYAGVHFSMTVTFEPAGTHARSLCCRPTEER